MANQVTVTCGARTLVVCAAASAALVGCFGGGRSITNVAEFANVRTVEAFVGDYENLGQPERDDSSYLSRLIWKNDPQLKHGKIKTIQVRSAGSRKLVVRGLDAEGYEVKSAIFEEGTDFRLRSGVIQLESHTDAAASGLYPMGPMAVVTHESVLLGLDREGNAQQVTETKKGGVFLVIPVAGSDARGKLFPRVKEGVVLAVGKSRLLDSYPVCTVTIFAPNYASVPDVFARTMTRKLAQLWGEQVYLSSTRGHEPIGTGGVAKEAADGYSLLMHSSYALNAAVYENLPYGPNRDFAPVAPLMREPTVLVVGPDSEFHTVAELIAAGRAKPGGLRFGSGTGTAIHLDAEKFKLDAGIEARHVPYKWDYDAMTDTTAGRVDFTFSTLHVALPAIRAGRLRALAVSGKRRNDDLPDVPTMAEAGVGQFDYAIWTGLWAPAGVPVEFQQKIAADVTGVLALPELQKEIVKLGAEPVAMSQTEFARFVRRDIEDSVRVARAAGMRQ